MFYLKAPYKLLKVMPLEKHWHNNRPEVKAGEMKEWYRGTERINEAGEGYNDEYDYPRKAVNQNLFDKIMK